MKKRGLALLLVPVMLFGVSVAVGAASSSSADFTIIAEIITPIELSLINGLDFGKVFKGDMGVIVDPTSPAPGTTPATFQVNGEPNSGFTVTLPTTTSISDGTTFLDVNNFTSTLTNDMGTLDGSGLATFNVGATLDSVPETATSGVYTGSATVTVVYSY